MGGGGTVMRRFAAVVEVVGLLCLVVAGGLVDVRLGLAVLGAVLVLVGVALDSPRPRVPE